MLTAWALCEVSTRKAIDQLFIHTGCDAKYPVVRREHDNPACGYNCNPV